MSIKECVEQQSGNTSNLENLGVLVAEDCITTGNIYSDMLKQLGLRRIIRAMNGAEAVMLYKEFKPEVLLLDIEMPELNGFQVCAAIREIEAKDTVRFLRTHIIMITSRISENDQKKGFDSGADDYIKKPISPIDFAARINVACRIALHTRSMRKEWEKFATLSRTDELTGLSNRRHCLERLREEISRLSRVKRKLSLLMVDCDNFKQVNDGYGHDVGDLVLIHVANLLRQGLRVSDVVGRYGGDEFICLLPETSVQNAVLTAKRLIETVKTTPFRWRNDLVDSTIPLSISIGCSTITPRAGGDGDRLISSADKALFIAKSYEGKGSMSYEEILSPSELVQGAASS